MEEDGVHLWGDGWRVAGGGRIQSVKLGSDGAGVGSERAEPVDDEAPQSGVGTVTQQGQDFTGFPHPKEGDRRPSLTFRQSVPGLFRDDRAVPDRGGHQRSLGGSPGDRESDHAIALRLEFPAPPEVSGRVETNDWIRLEGTIALPDGGVGSFRMRRLHDLGERREVSDGIEVGVLLHVTVIGVAVLDRLAEQAEGSLRQRLTPRLVHPGNRLRCQGVGTGGIVVQTGILGLALEGRFEPLQRLVGSLTQFRGHDDRQVEFLALAARFLSRNSPDPPSPGPCDPAGRGRWHGTDKPGSLVAGTS